MYVFAVELMEIRTRTKRRRKVQNEKIKRRPPLNSFRLNLMTRKTSQEQKIDYQCRAATPRSK
jgi:hypothetical protein